MKCVAGGALRHHLMPLVGANYFADLGVFTEHRQFTKKMQTFLALGGRIGVTLQFLQDGVTGEKFVVVAILVPTTSVSNDGGKGFQCLCAFRRVENSESLSRYK